MREHKIAFSITGFIDSFLTCQQYSAKSNIQLVFSHIMPISIPDKEKKNSLLQNFQTYTRAHLASYSMRIWCYFQTNINLLAPEFYI